VAKIKANDIETPRELVRYICSYLTKDWDVHVDEVVSCQQSHIVGARNEHYWTVSARCHQTGFSIHAFMLGPTLKNLVTRIQVGELWNKIREDFEKQSIKWQPAGAADRLGNPTPSLEGRKPLALTHKQ